VVQDGAVVAHSAKRPLSGPRISVTIPPDFYEQVSSMAKAKKVSKAWIIRDALEKYIEADAPLFAGKEAR
jgi:metal-responsive CopG/Arc/MetJ family transcriptional regulator